MPRAILRGHLYAFAVFILFQVRAEGVVLDWDTVTWPDGSLSNSYHADPMAPGNDITVAVTSNNGAPLVPFSGAPNPQTPTVGAYFQGGLPMIENTLVLAVDLANPTQSITITISLANPGGVTGLSFKLFDIDAGGGSQDQLTSIQGLSIDGTTLIAPTITTSANNTLIGSGLGQSVVGTAPATSTGPQSGLGNVTIDFGSAVIQSLTFTFGCTATFADPAYQHFALHDISWTPEPVPEMNPALVSILVCLAAAGTTIRRSKRGAREKV
jgi:hypothetical protein